MCSIYRVAPSLVCVALSLLVGCGGLAYEGHRIRLAGAQIPLELMESWLRTSSGPRFDTQRVGEAVWSQTGFEALREGTADLACTDRPIGAQELAEFGERKIEGMRIGFYGFAFYGHPSNKLDSL